MEQRREGRRVVACVLQWVGFIAFLLDLGFIFVLFQQQNHYSSESQQAQSDRFNSTIYALMAYAFLGMAVLFGGVVATSKSLRRLEARSSGVIVGGRRILMSVRVACDRTGAKLE